MANSKPLPLSPLQLYQQIFCRNCDLKCDPISETFRTCVQCLLADELARLRSIIQSRTQHLSW
jgi:hypothetical protein